MDILTSSANADRHGRFAVRVRCPGEAPGACRGWMAVNKGGDHLAGARFRLDRASKGDVGLRLDHHARKALARHGALRVLVTVTPSDRSVVRHESTARVRLVSGHKLGHAVRRLTRGQARRLVGKYRMIAENWNR